MPDLEMLLRDVRPAPDPVWAERLDEKVAAGFRRPPKRRFWQVSFLSVRQQLFAMCSVGLVAGLAALLVITNMGSYTSSSSSDLSMPAAAKAPSSAGSSASKSADSATSTQTPAPMSTFGGSSGSAAAPTRRGSAAAPTRRRAVIASANLTLTTASDDVESVTDRAIRLTDTLGGFVQTSSTSREGAHATATLSLKLPSDKLDAGIAQLSKLAHVRSRSQEAEDVTDQRSVLEGAVRDARADREGLRVRLAKATTDKERSRLRALLDRASRRVTQRERDVAQLGQQTSFSTVDLRIVGTRKAAAAPAPAGRWTPGDAAKDAGRVLEVIAGVLVIAFAILVPLGILAGLAVFANRGLTRRRRERALEAS
jgi:hypothetical protein